MGAGAERRLQLRFQLTEPVVTFDEADFSDLMRRNAFQIAQLVVKAAQRVRLQHLRHRHVGKPAVVVENVHRGGAFPAAVQHLFRHRRREIAGKQQVAVQIVHARAVAGDQPGGQRDALPQDLHLQQVTAGSEGQLHVALM